MNKNIEIINDNLIAVKFSMIPWIKEIEWKPDYSIPLEEQFGSISEDGVLILNKDYRGYKLISKEILKIMKNTDRKLIKIKKRLDFNVKSQVDKFKLNLVNIELIRRNLIDKNDPELRLRG